MGLVDCVLLWALQGTTTLAFKFISGRVEFEYGRTPVGM